MTPEQTGAVMDLLSLAYPNFGRGMTDKRRIETSMLWAAMFDEDDAGVVLAAVKALIATKTDDWPPVIGAVKDRIRQITTPTDMTESEAWAIVNKAIQNANYNSVAEFERLPPMLQQLVGSPSQLRDWARMDADTVQSVVASNFKRSYRARVKSGREYDALPSDVKALAVEISGGLSRPNAPEQRTIFQLRKAPEVWK